ncbi:hypothetical protein GSY74_07765 [Sulfurovum sp. bin170]|uniref:CDC27 family protein n=1 Tax=Sulfurovum sp. bin170 TaxID=2695268 RepID=UPI0013DE9164|nr:CDC27 family protein [Sulfurovum sp. bin170]NEW61176.1 hypothetical protein [Sulfurovum sp. bin170]
MINTKELEKRWYRYKAKSLILVFSILVVLLILIYGGYYILYKLDLNISFGEQSKQTAVMDAKVDKESNETVTEEKRESDEVMLAPTIPIVDLESEKINDKKERRRVAEKKRVKSKEKLVKVKASTYLTAQELAVVNGSSLNSRETKKINLHGTSNNYMNIMKKKFEQNKNPREALLIAKAYYKAGNYENSEKWALKANNLDKKLDESWLIFASSQEKLGKQQEALKILIAYYRTSKSPKAKALIDKIKAKSI